MTSHIVEKKGKVTQNEKSWIFVGYSKKVWPEIPIYKECISTDAVKMQIYSSLGFIINNTIFRII